MPRKTAECGGCGRTVTRWWWIGPLTLCGVCSLDWAVRHTALDGPYGRSLPEYVSQYRNLEE